MLAGPAIQRANPDTLPLNHTTQGQHTLTLQFANALHESYGSKWASAPLIVSVK